jgi:hypothetical protein
MTNQQKLAKLKKQYGNDIFIAEAFVRLLQIKKSDKLYPSAIEWVITEILDDKKDTLTKKERQQFEKDNKEKKVGVVHKKIIKQIGVLYKINQVLDGKDDIATSKLDDSISAAPASPLPNTGSVKKEKPEVKLESNAKRVPKGGSVNLVWTTKNATKIRRTNIPGITTKSPLNGSIEVDDIRRRRDFYIIVEGPGGSAESRVTTLVETQAFLQGKEKEPVNIPQPDVTPRRTPTSLVSPSSRPQQQTRTSSSATTSGGDASSLNLGILLSIDKSLLNVSKILFGQLRLNQRAFDLDRRGRESEIRQRREEEMEADKGASGGELMKKGAEKILSPFKAIIDKIVNFLFFTFLGRVFTDLVKWFNDPENKGKVEALGRFIKTLWPLIVGAALLFLTPLGGFIVGVVQFLIGTYKTLKGLKGLIDRLIFKKKAKPGAKPGAKTSSKPKVTAGTGGTTPKRPLGGGTKITGDVSKPGFKMPKFRPSGGNIASALIGFGLETGTNLIFGNVRENMVMSAAEKINLLPENEKKDAIEKIEKHIKTQEKLGVLGNSETIDYLKSVLNYVNSKPQKMSVGGKVFSGLVKETDGIKVSGAGSDTQAFPIMGGGMAVLQPGEIVLNKQGVQNAIKLGIDPLELNTGPNANKPQKVSGGNIKLMNTGGVVGSKMTPISNKKMGNRSMSPSSTSSPMISRGSQTNSSISSPMISRGSQSNSSISSPMRPRLFSNTQMSNYSPPKTRGMAQNFGFSGPLLSARSYIPNYSTPQESITAEYKKETPLISSEKIRIPSFNSILPSDSNFRIRRVQTDISPRPLSRLSNNIATITLPPITQTAGTATSPPGSGTKLPTFSATPSGLADVRMTMANIYGIV